MVKYLYLMRHGQTLFNQRHLIQGWCDSPLTDLGVYQAQVAGHYFEENKIQFDAAFSSTSERACDTLEIATKGATPYQRIKGLKEWNFGVFEGESEDLNPPLPYRDFFVGYGGESQTAVQERMDATIRQLMEQTDGKNILMVSHGGSLFNFARVHQKNWQVHPQGHIGNCCVFVFRYENHNFYLEEVVEHDFSQWEG
ncbi:histidine phosphatase family protein [Streptococcus mitis]|uniref:histidine phosphatase family protein n=1 Tax=Streptococcus mitis TaxID=28037 RepID=UPI001CC02477|nr:histidine phosphatase family protein [Streptococcus mitis]MBZ2099201.1 histidine phosphatase family protein [Streptococcus mitis]MBZ2104942.1 histidine phosphatase family protein [Streptococcus mitis]MBZ2108478.1 histidine phosphatase family protein [Streptococcus mitis]